MNCLICDSKSSFYFSKNYLKEPYNRFMDGIGPVEYFKCNYCGFVFSKTHRNLPSEKWEKLNFDFHHFMESQDPTNEISQPPYLEQAMMIAILGRNKIINLDSMIDFAAGYGTLGSVLDKYFNISLNLYDPYVKYGNDGRYINLDKESKFETVISSAFFEHILDRSDIENLNRLVSDIGCMFIHTVICENVPKDPNWFYLEPPVHTAFFTNKSLDLLMEQWNYSYSAYCPKAKSWVLFKNDNFDETRDRLSQINKEFQSAWFFTKKGFVDYWKGF